MAHRNGSPRIGTQTNAHVRSRQAGKAQQEGRRTQGDVSKPIIPISLASGSQFGVGPKGNVKGDRATSVYSGPSGGNAGAWMRGTTQSGILSGAEISGNPVADRPNLRSGRRGGVGGQTKLAQQRGPARKSRTTTRKNQRRRSFS